MTYKTIELIIAFIGFLFLFGFASALLKFAGITG